jgi:four helix bundle protein
MEDRGWKIDGADWQWRSKSQNRFHRFVRKWSTEIQTKRASFVAMIRSFRDLDVYQLAREQARKLFFITKTFPKEEKYSLTDQIRRSSRAVTAMIAESWARRKYVDSFSYKLYEAMGEGMETQSWLDHALDCNYLVQEQYQDLNAAWQRVGAMLNRMIERADTFCKTTR